MEIRMRKEDLQVNLISDSLHQHKARLKVKGCKETKVKKLKIIKPQINKLNK